MPAASAPLGTSGPVLGVAHPLYIQYRPKWQQCLDVYEGAGGFLSNDKPYLIAHPREYLDHSIPVYAEDGVTVKTYEPNPNPSNASPKLLERRKLARYENYAATLIDQLSAALFRVKRKVTFAEDSPVPAGGKRPIEQFWDDADGMGTCWEELLKQYWKVAGVFGHVVLYFDLPADDSDRVVPVVRAYTPLDVPDWLVDERGRLIQIKLMEATPRESFKTPVGSAARQVRVRVLTTEGWSLQRPNGTAIDVGDWGGAYEGLPVAILYAKRRAIVPYVGKSVLGDPMNFIDLYNLISEVRELLRKETFSILNVPIGENGSVDQERALIGRQGGTGNILFTTGNASYISADSKNVEVYHLHIDRLLRSIFRQSMLPWEGDSKQTESADSRRMKREDLNQLLSDFADELQKVDLTATDLVYQAVYGSAWKKWKTADGVSIGWPDSFETTPLEDLLTQFADGVRMELGETATKETKKRAARALLPDLSADRLKEIDDDIDDMQVLTEAERRQQQLTTSMGRLAGALPKASNPAQAVDPEEPADPQEGPDA